MRHDKWPVRLAALTVAVPCTLSAQSFRADYPPKALREHREGTTQVAVAVDKEGQPKDCKLITSSGSSDLDEATCQTTYRRAHWFPAKDEHGEPIASSVTMKIKWQLPRPR